jgi:nucleoside-diphosphate-sugar epimerase
MKILVTGGAGYLGALLIPSLLDGGREVVLFDNFAFGVRPILHFASHPRLEIIRGDVRDTAAVKAILGKADCVMHLAAVVGFPACAADPDAARSINTQGAANVAAALSQNQISIFASTGSAYGKVAGVCDEATPIAPLTLYGETKAEGEKMFADKGGVGLRFATVFGVSPRLRLDLLVNDFVYQALHSRQIILYEGHFRRTFLHARDAAAAFVFALENFEAMRGEAFNVGDEKMNYTKRDIARAVGEKTDYYLHEADIGEDLDRRDYEVSYAKIKKLGYRADITLDAGIDELIKVLLHLHIRSEWRNA